MTIEFRVPVKLSNLHKRYPRVGFSWMCLMLVCRWRLYGVYYTAMQFAVTVRLASNVQYQSGQYFYTRLTNRLPT